MRRGACVAAVMSVACGPQAPVPADSDAGASATGDEGGSSPTTDRPLTDDGSDDPTGPPDPPRWDLPPDADSSGGDDAIDCLSIDPARVYLRGTLEEGATYRGAFTDPTDPTTFCVGFVNSVFPRIRPADGGVVFVDEYDGGGILEFEPDPIGVDPKGDWIYPEDPYGNDALLMPSPCNGDGLGPILISPVDGRAWFACGGRWFDPDGALAWGWLYGNGVAIAPDGRLLVNDLGSGSDLYLVTPGRRPELALPLPREVDAVVTGRVHDDGLWLVALAGSQMFRWHLVDEAIVEEGEYSGTDVDILHGYGHQGVLDGDGDYFHIGSISGDPPNDVIVRRRLAPEASVIVYAESELDASAVRIYLSGLFTGP
jgi:hypothetical protein